jgi:hypothetical protein
VAKEITIKHFHLPLELQEARLNKDFGLKETKRQGHLFTIHMETQSPLAMAS